MSNNVVTLKSGSKVTQRSSKPARIDPSPMTFKVTIGLSCSVSEIDDDFSRIIETFSTSVYLTPPLKGFHLELGISARGQEH